MKPSLPTTHKSHQIQHIGLLVIRKRPNIQLNLKPSYQTRDLKDSNCYIDDQRFSNEVRQCFKYAIEGKFKSLSMQRNKNPDILKEISHIRFSGLRVLELGANSINSIEALGWLNVGNLRTLDLQQNLIVSSKPLAKFYTKSISELKIGRNLFTDLEQLTRMKFRVNENYRDLQITDLYGIRPYNKCHINVYFLAKFDDPEDVDEEWIKIFGKHQIRLPKFYKSIQKKKAKQGQISFTFNNNRSNF